MIGNKTADKITTISGTSRQNNSETDKKEHDRKISNEKCIYPEEKQKIIDDLRLM